MDSPTVAALPTPPYHRSPTDEAADDAATTPPPPSPSSKKNPKSPSPLHLSNYSLHDLLLLSPPPSSTHRRARSRVAAAAAVDESIELAGGGATPRRKRKGSRGAAEQRPALVGSPRNARRARRRLDKEIGREEREREVEEDAQGKARRRKQTRTVAKAAAVAEERVVMVQKEDLSRALVASLPTDATRRTGNVEQSSWESLWGSIVELVMWKNVTKSSLWFGFGSMFFFSSSFSKDINFSSISVICHLGVMILGYSFFRDSVPQRQPVEWRRSFQLTEDDIVRAARVVLPIANSAILSAQVIFSGDPSMTLKMLPVFLFGAKYGSLITVRRLLATGFFASFTLPKFYACYSHQIHRRVDGAMGWVREAWKSCPRKKLVAATAATVCWNMVSVKTRVMAAFISVVILRYYHQYCRVVKNPEREVGQEEQQKGMVIDH